MQSVFHKTFVSQDKTRQDPAKVSERRGALRGAQAVASVHGLYSRSIEENIGMVGSVRLKSNGNQAQRSERDQQ